MPPSLNVPLPEGYSFEVLKTSETGIADLVLAGGGTRATLRVAVADIPWAAAQLAQMAHLHEKFKRNASERAARRGKA